MKIKVNEQEKIAIISFKGNITEKDMELFEKTLLTLLEKNSKIIVSLARARSAETAEWQIANALCKVVNEATKQNKKIAIACLPSEVLSKANKLMLGAKVRIFSQDKAAIAFLANIAA